MVHQCYWRPDILFFYSEIGQSTNLQPTLSKSRWPLVQLNADNSVAYGEYLTAARCLEPDS